MLWTNPNDHLQWIPMRKMQQIESFMPEIMRGVFKKEQNKQKIKTPPEQPPQTSN